MNSTATPYLRHANLYFLPVVRHHLTFAILVQRAVHQLGLGAQDMIAVELPPSLKGVLTAAINNLPRVSLIVSSLSDADQREVYPVTPCDGIIEGVRIAAEQQIPLAFIDQEIAPGHLVNRICIPDSAWPDDAIALAYGVEWYLNLIQERIARPPTRFEPIDTWRELHMARELQCHYPSYRRILVLCSPTHIYPLRQMLGEPAPLVTSTPLTPAATTEQRYTILEPNATILIRYLDYIPRLVELYERRRAKGEAKDFDKWEAFFEAIHDLITSASDVNFSLRHQQAFAHLLTKMTAAKQRLSPRFDMVVTASQGCFSNTFAERLYRYLLGYFDQVRVERMGRIVATKELFADVVLDKVRDSRQIFVARNCTQIEQTYEIYYLPNELSGEGPSSAVDQPNAFVKLQAAVPFDDRLDNKSSSYWPDYGQFENALQAKARRLAQGVVRRTRSAPFQGSLFDGVDLRRTVRSYYSGDQTLYVRQHQVVRQANDVPYEPIVWLFNIDKGTDRNLSYTTIGLRGGPEYVHSWYSSSDEVEVYNGLTKHNEPVRVYYVRLFGSAFFTEAGRTVATIKEQLGRDFSRRVPSIRKMTYSPRFGYVLRSQRTFPAETLSWWELLLMGALDYAEQTVIVVTPERFTLPVELARAAQLSNKRFTQVYHNAFTHTELQKLSIRWFIEHTMDKEVEVTDPAYLQYLRDHFGEVMKQFF